MIHAPSGERLAVKGKYKLACFLVVPRGRHAMTSEATRPRGFFRKLQLQTASADTDAAERIQRDDASTSVRDNEAAKLVVLTTMGCPYCRQTKAALQDGGIPYQEVDLSTQLDALQLIKQQTGRHTVPQVFVDGKLIGGSAETLELLESGELKIRLQAARQASLPEKLRMVLEQQGSENDLENLLLPEGMPKERYLSLRAISDELLRTPSGRLRWKVAEMAQLLKKQGVAEDNAGARELIDGMLDAGLVASSGKDDEDLLIFTRDLLQRQSSNTPLNATLRWRRKPRPASKVAEILRQAILRLYEKHLTQDGKSVRYGALSEDPDFQLFVTATGELQGVDPTPLTRAERIAFFVNIYNVLIVHAHASLDGPQNLLSRLRWFSSIKYEIGGLEYSADDIEHGILRGNRPTASSIAVLLGHPEWSSGYFKQSDPRLAQSVKNMDKRIHFALNCGAKSCPPIKVYSPETLEEGLQSAATAFCEGEASIDSQAKTVRLSKIFKWYGMDFGPKEELLHWLLEYLPEGRAEALRGLLREEGTLHIKLKYKDYDWGLNNG